MSKKDEALKLALEALMEATKIHASSCKCSVCSAVIVAQDALAEQPAQQSHCDDCGGFDPKCPLARPAQQQEPVAWRDPKNVDPGQGCTYDKVKQEKWPHIYTQPLYTSPQPAQPSKPWVGLTRPEIAKLSADAQVDFCLDKQPTYEVALTRAIEAKLREKNA